MRDPRADAAKAPPSPGRDRAVATTVRHGPRRAEGLSDFADAFLRSEAGRTMKRFTRVADALAEVLPAAHVAGVRAVSLSAGVLTLDVADSVLLAELRGHSQSALLNALARHGTAATRIRWRVAKRTG